MPTIQDLFDDLNAQNDNPEDMFAELNAAPYLPPSIPSGVTLLGPGDRMVPAEETIFPLLPSLFRSAIAGAAAAGASIENPVYRFIGRGDLADQNRRAVEHLRAYNRELNKDSILGETVGTLVGDVADSLSVGTLAAPFGGLAAVSVVFGVDGADRAYVEARDAGLPDDEAAWGAARQFLIDGALTYFGGKFAESMGFNAGRYFGPSTAKAVNAAAEHSGLKRVMGSTLLDSGINGLQGGLTYLNSVYAGTTDFDLKDFSTATGMSAAAGGLAGAVTSGSQVAPEAFNQFKKNIPRAMESLKRANKFAADKTHTERQAALDSTTAKEFEAATGEKRTNKMERGVFKEELQALSELEAEINRTGLDTGKSIEAEEAAIASERKDIEGDLAEAKAIEKSLAETGETSDALPEGFGERTLQVRKLRESVEERLGGIDQKEKRLQRRREASEGEIAEQRAFLESEFNRLAAEEKTGGREPLGADEVKATEQPLKGDTLRSKPVPKKIEKVYKDVETARSSVDVLRVQAEAGETLNVDTRRDLATLIDAHSQPGASRISLFTKLAAADTPKKLSGLLDQLGKQLDKSELRTAKAEFNDAVDRTQNLQPEFKSIVEDVASNTDKGSTESLRQASDSIREAAYQSVMADRFLTMDARKRITETSAQVVDEISDARSLVMKSDDVIRKAVGKVTPGLEITRDNISFDSPLFREMAARPEVQLARLSETLREQIWERLGVQAQSVYDLSSKETQQGFSDFLDSLGLDHAPTLDSTLSGNTLENWRTELAEIDGESPGFGEPGSRVKLSRDEAFGLFLLGLDPRNSKAMEKVGFKFPDGRKFDVVNERVRNQLLDFIGDEGLQMAEWSFDYLNGPLIDRVNDAKRLTTGRPLTDRRDVVPRNVSKTWDITGETPMAAMRDATLTSYGHLRHRTETASPLTWPEGTTGGVDYFLNHADRMNRIAAFLPAARDVETILNRPEVRRAILSKDGTKGLENIEEAVRIQTIGSKRPTSTDVVIRRWNALNAAGLLGARLSTTFIQGMSTIASAAYDTAGLRGYLKTGLSAAMSSSNLKLMQDTLGQFSGHYWRRYESRNFITEQTGGVYQNRGWFRPPQVAHHALRPLQEVERVLNSPWRFMKSRADAQQQGLQEGTPEWSRFVSRAWERATYRGENTSQGMELSGFLRVGRDNPAFGTMVTFQNTASKIYSLFPRAADLADAGQYKDAIGVLATATATILPVALIRQAMTFEKSDDPFLEAAGKRAIRDVANLHALGGLAIVPIIKKMQGVQIYGNDSALLGSVGDLGIAVGELASGIIDNGDASSDRKSFFEKLTKVAIPLLTMNGIPIKGVADFQRRLKEGTLFPGLESGQGPTLQETVDLMSFGTEDFQRENR